LISNLSLPASYHTLPASWNDVILIPYFADMMSSIGKLTGDSPTPCQKFVSTPQDDLMAMEKTSLTTWVKGEKEVFGYFHFSTTVWTFHFFIPSIKR